MEGPDGKKSQGPAEQESPQPMFSPKVAHLLLAAALPFPLWASTAQAQDSDHVVLGAGVATAPAYQGSDEYRILPIPAIDIKEGPFFANFRNGVGLAPVDSDVLTIGASATFIPGYRRRDVPAGIDKLSDGLGARIFAAMRTHGFVATVGATKGVAGGTKGVIADASLAYPVTISSAFSLTPSVGATWADRKHNDRYFGITASESTASGLAQFRAGSGFKDISAALTASYRLTDRVTMSATGTITTLVGDVKDSPLVVEKTRPAGFLALSYRF